MGHQDIAMTPLVCPANSFTGDITFRISHILVQVNYLHQMLQ
nr:hypothetical protein Iba_scaffold18202CG0050 [Ipomoea batatas]